MLQIINLRIFETVICPRFRPIEQGNRVLACDATVGGKLNAIRREKRFTFSRNKTVVRVEYLPLTRRVPHPIGLSVSKILVILIIIILFFVFLQYTSGNKKAALENKQKGAEYLAANRNLEGVETTESGLQYKVLQRGTGRQHPKAADTVKVHYHGTLLDGSVFDSSVERGEPIEFSLHQVIKGWTEGLQLMVLGEKTRFFIPSELAYGDRAAGSIGPGSTLIFDVELLGINQ